MRRIALALSLVVLAGCGDDDPYFGSFLDGGAGQDVGSGDAGGSDITGSDATDDAGADSGDDAGTDAGDDTGTDTGADTTNDTGSDTGADTTADTGSDTGTDTTTDTGSDTGTDTATDTGSDTGTDTATETGSDTGTDTGGSSNVCVNASDDVTLAFGAEGELAAAVGCGDDCSGDAICTLDCARETSALSDACSICFANLGACVDRNCGTACSAGDLSVPACASCVEAQCAPAFGRCSGRADILPEPVDPDACVTMEPGALDIGEVPAGGFETDLVTVRNCGGAGDPDVAILRTRIEGTDADRFEVVSTETFPDVIAPGETSIVEVGYRPGDASDTANLIVVTDAGELRTTLRGQLQAVAGPVIAGGCRVLPADTPASTVALTLPDSLACTAEGTTGAASYLWEWVSRPTGSAARILGPTRLQAPIVLDRVGRYTIRLTATATGGATSTRTYTIDATAPTSDGLVVAMFWDTPAETDPFDADGFAAGSDMDIHLRETSLGCWATNPADCYYANLNPDWGTTGATNNPQLVADDTASFGPEIIEIPTPDQTAVYEVAAHYWDPQTFGASAAIFVTYLDGALLNITSGATLTVEKSWNIALELAFGFTTWEVFPVGTVTTTDPALCE